MSEWYLNCSEVLREENMDLIPTQQTNTLLTHLMFLVQSMPISI